MTPSFVTVATVSINQTVGDWVGNQERILQAIEQAKTEGKAGRSTGNVHYGVFLRG